MNLPTRCGHGLLLRSTVLMILAAHPAMARGQVPTGIAVVDSAAAARGAYGRAVRSDDPAVARAEIERATSAWPTQPAYVWARAVLAARAGDTATALSALSEYADLSLGRDLRAVADFKSLVALPAFAPLEARHVASRLALQRSRVIATVADSSIWPEGIAHDPRSGTFYLGSIQHGAVVAISSAGAVSELWGQSRGSESGVRAGAVLAVRVDTARNALWVTTSGMPHYEGRLPADSAIASLLRISLADGTIEQRWKLPVQPRGHVLGDVAVGPHGDVFVSDSNHPVVYWLKPGASVLESIRSPLFNSPQGLAPTPDGRTLYIADHSHGLMRMDLASGSLHRLTDAPRSTSLGLDGIAWYEGSIIGIQNGVSPARVVRFHLDSAGRIIKRAEVIDQNIPLADEPTAGTIVGREFVYVANSQWDKRDATGKVRATARLTGPVLLGVPLK